MRLFICIVLGLFSLPFFSQQPTSLKKHYVGEIFGGGIVFYVYEDSIGNQHGLIASLNDLSSSCRWGFPDLTVPNCNSTWDGASNTLAYIAAGGKPYFAVGLCASFSYDGFSDWYMPSIDEFKDIFKLLADSKYVVMSSTSSSLGIIEKIVEPVPVKEWLSIPDEVIICETTLN